MKRGEKGFTLIEMIVTLAVLGAMGGAIAMTTTTLLTNPERSNDQNIVLQQVQNAGYWISLDVQMAETVTLGEDNGFPVTLVIPVNTNPANDYSVTYSFDGSNLERQVDSEVTLIAEYIVVTDTSFIEVVPGVYKSTIKVSKGEASVERVYEITLRIGST